MLEVGRDHCVPVALAVVALGAHDGDVLAVSRALLEIRNSGGVELARDRREAEPGRIAETVAIERVACPERALERLTVELREPGSRAKTHVDDEIDRVLIERREQQLEWQVRVTDGPDFRRQ